MVVVALMLVVVGVVGVVMVVLVLLLVVVVVVMVACAMAKFDIVYSRWQAAVAVAPAGEKKT